MSFFAEGVVDIVGVVRQIIYEEIRYAVKANHIAYIEVAHECQRQEDNIHAEISVFDKLLDGIGYNGQPNDGIDPHRVSGERILRCNA